MTYNEEYYKNNSKKLKSISKMYSYYNYIMRLMCCFMLPWALPLFDVTYSNPLARPLLNVFIIFFVLITGYFIFSRKFLIGMLSTVEMDWHTLYEIDKRKDNKRNEIHNLYLLMHRNFWDGEFNETIECANKIISLSNKKETIYEAKNLLMISEFFRGNYDCVVELINEQRNIGTLKKSAKQEEKEIYYQFFEKYIEKDYENAANVIKRLFNVKNIKILCNRRILVHYLLVMAYRQLDNEEMVNKCIEYLENADEHKLTYFYWDTHKE